MKLLLLLMLATGVLACASAPAQGGGAAAPLLAGVARIDITPDEPIRLTGYGNRTTPSEGAEGRLAAKALAFGGPGARPSVLVTADLIAVPREMVDELAVRLRRAGVERADLAVAATHTHNGPSIAGVLPFIFGTPLSSEEREAVERYSSEVVNRLEQVALAALADRKPATLAWGRGRAPFAANRRVLKDGKWVGFGINPSGPVDHDLPILTVRAPDGALRAVLVNYACHATTLEGKQNFVHGDWPGAAQALIEARHPGAVALVTIGTGADANPNPRGGGLPHVEAHAAAIADEADRLLRAPLHPVRSSPAGRVTAIDLAFRDVPGRTEWEALAGQKGAPGLHARAMLERLDRGDTLPVRATYPIQTWAFGRDLLMVFLAGEVVADYGLRLRRELDGERVWVTAYANDVAFYVPSRRMIPEGGYEVDGSMVYYGQPGPLAEGTEEQIIRAVKRLAPAGFRR